MSAPLYCDHQSPEAKPDSAHAGLWFDRFFNRYEPNWSLANEAKRDWINTVRGLVGQQSQLENFAARQIALVRQLNGRSQRYSTDWHFVTGMGNPHPVENGFSWHPTLGVAYLAGAAVKGLVRAWVELNEDGLSEAEQKARLKNWFGSEKKGDAAEQAGGFIFFDAIPDQRPGLICDIMTSHMGDWYSEGDKGDPNNSKAIPADWHEPVPVPFLAVKQAQLIFSIAPRGSDLSDQLDVVFTALSNALEWLGAGAKTAVGYGYMSLDQAFVKEQAEAEQKRAEQQRLASLNEQQQQIDALRKVLQHKRQIKARELIGGPLYNDLRKLVESAENWSAEDKSELKALAVEIIEFITSGKANQTAKKLIRRLDADS